MGFLVRTPLWGQVVRDRAVTYLSLEIAQCNDPSMHLFISIPLTIIHQHPVFRYLIITQSTYLKAHALPSNISLALRSLCTLGNPRCDMLAIPGRQFGCVWMRDLVFHRVFLSSYWFEI